MFAKRVKERVGPDGWRLLVPELRIALVAEEVLTVVKAQDAATVSVADVNDLYDWMLRECGLIEDPRYNPDCDKASDRLGAVGCSSREVRYLPLPGGAGLHVCRYHHGVEIAWRSRRNRELAADARYPLPTWDELEVRRG